MRWLLALSLAVAVAQTAWAQASEFDVAVFRTQRGPELTVVDGVVEFEPQLVAAGRTVPTSSASRSAILAVRRFSVTGGADSWPAMSRRRHWSLTSRQGVSWRPFSSR
jgi:hypothetical protein